MEKLTEEKRDTILISLNEGIKTLNKRVDSIDDKVTSLSKRVDNIDDNVKSLSGEVKSLSKRFDERDAIIYSMNESIKTIKEELAKKPDEEKVRQIVREELADASFLVEQPIKLKMIS